MKLTILVENTVRRNGLSAEHGLSFWIELDQENLLFDTGQTDLYLKNACQLGIDLSKTDRIILSHGHYDHGGGLADYPYWQNGPRLIAHPAAFERKFERCCDGQEKDIGLSDLFHKRPDIKQHLMPNNHTLQVAENAYVCAQINKTAVFENENPRLGSASDGQHPDKMRDEQFLMIDGSDGLIIILGCSHPGLISCLEFARKCMPGRSIDTVIGGLHLAGLPQNRLDLTIEALAEMQIKRLIPLHCTGQAESCQMAQRLGNRVKWHQTGDTISL